VLPTPHRDVYAPVEIPLPRSCPFGYDDVRQALSGPRLSADRTRPDCPHSPGGEDSLAPAVATNPSQVPRSICGPPATSATTQD
jgi:hypothetical protein